MSEVKVEDLGGSKYTIEHDAERHYIIMGTVRVWVPRQATDQDAVDPLQKLLASKVHLLVTEGREKGITSATLFKTGDSPTVELKYSGRKESNPPTSRSEQTDIVKKGEDWLKTVTVNEAYLTRLATRGKARAPKKIEAYEAIIKIFGKAIAKPPEAGRIEAPPPKAQPPEARTRKTRRAKAPPKAARPPPFGGVEMAPEDPENKPRYAPLPRTASSTTTAPKKEEVPRYAALSRRSDELKLVDIPGKEKLEINKEEFRIEKKGRRYKVDIRDKHRYAALGKKSFNSLQEIKDYIERNYKGAEVRVETPSVPKHKVPKKPSAAKIVAPPERPKMSDKLELVGERGNKKLKINGKEFSIVKRGHGYIVEIQADHAYATLLKGKPFSSPGQILGEIERRVKGAKGRGETPHVPKTKAPKKTPAAEKGVSQYAKRPPISDTITLVGEPGKPKKLRIENQKFPIVKEGNRFRVDVQTDNDYAALGKTPFSSHDEILDAAKRVYTDNKKKVSEVGEETPSAPEPKVPVESPYGDPRLDILRPKEFFIRVEGSGNTVKLFHGKRSEQVEFVFIKEGDHFVFEGSYPTEDRVDLLKQLPSFDLGQEFNNIEEIRKFWIEKGKFKEAFTDSDESRATEPPDELRASYLPANLINMGPNDYSFVPSDDRNIVTFFVGSAGQESQLVFKRNAEGNYQLHAAIKVKNLALKSAFKDEESMPFQKIKEIFDKNGFVEYTIPRFKPAESEIDHSTEDNIVCSINVKDKSGIEITINYNRAPDGSLYLDAESEKHLATFPWVDTKFPNEKKLAEFFRYHNEDKQIDDLDDLSKLD